MGDRKRPNYSDLSARNEEMKRKRDAGMTYAAIAQQFGLSESAARAAIRRISHPSVPPGEWGDRGDPWVTKPCTYCDNPFELLRQEYSLRDFCSRECYLAARKGGK